MNEWMENFISQCLADVPPGKYRTRMEKELRDHMETQHEFLSEAEVLQAMGDPERLRVEYEAAWARTLRGQWALRPRLARPLIGVCLLTAHLYVLTVLILGWIGFDRSTGPLCLVYPLPNLIYCLTLYLVPTTLGALFLRFCFREERRPAPWITLGLLTAWTGEKVSLLLISAFFYWAHQHHRPPMTLWEVVKRTPWCPGDYSFLWQGIVYVLASFAGCLILGWLLAPNHRKLLEKHRKIAS